MRVIALYLLFFLAALTWMGFESGLIRFERTDRVKYDRKSAWTVEE